MLAMAVSLLFGLAAFAAFAVIRSSLVVAVGRARLILGDLAEIERGERASRSLTSGSRSRLAFRPGLAAA
jgi:hypothetical protein